MFKSSQRLVYTPTYPQPQPIVLFLRNSNKVVADSSGVHKLVRVLSFGLRQPQSFRSDFGKPGEP